MSRRALWVRGTDPPVTGTEALLTVEKAFNCNSSSYGFNCWVSREAPNGQNTGPQLALGILEDEKK